MNGRKATSLSDLGVTVLDCEHKTPPAKSDGHPYIAIPNIVGGRVDLSDVRRISDDDLAEWTRRTTPRPGDVIVTRRGRVGDTAPVPQGLACAIGQNLVLLRADGHQIDQGFLLWATRSPQWHAEVNRLRNVGAVFSSLNVRDIARIELLAPSIREQRAIAGVLGTLDDKIAANAREVGLADDLAGTLFEAALAVGSEERHLGDVATFHNRRRVPLSSVERGARPGVVPYFGAAGRLGYVDEALFDGHLLLVGEDGSVVQGDGRPVTQYIWGPSWVNNHAHVLTGDGITTELLRLAVRRSSVVSLVTGAVQPKISMGNLKNLQLELPMGGQRGLLAEQVDALAAVLRAKTDESRSLAATRDALLPPLMLGKVSVKDAESVVEGVV